MVTRALAFCLLLAAFAAVRSSPQGAWTLVSHRTPRQHPTPGAIGLQEAPQSSRSLQALVLALTTDPDAKVREHAATALGTLGDGRACPALGDALLDDPSPRVREHAAEALGMLGAEESRDALLLAMLRDPEDRVRRHAAEALGMLGAGNGG